MEIRTIPIEKLSFSEYNPRVVLSPGDKAYKDLQRSIEAFGYVDPIIWNERTGNVVGGHQRLKVLTDMGKAEVEVSVVDLDAEREKALNIALNKISGEWDDEKLSVLLINLSEGDMLEFTGFTTVELSELLDSPPGGESDNGQDGSGEQDEDFSGAFRYREQYGVIVICKDESDQKFAYEKLSAMGYECKVVAT